MRVRRLVNGVGMLVACANAARLSAQRDTLIGAAYVRHAPPVQERDAASPVAPSAQAAGTAMGMLRGQQRPIRIGAKLVADVVNFPYLRSVASAQPGLSEFHGNGTVPGYGAGITLGYRFWLFSTEVHRNRLHYEQDWDSDYLGYTKVDADLVGTFVDADLGVTQKWKNTYVEFYLGGVYAYDRIEYKKLTRYGQLVPHDPRTLKTWKPETRIEFQRRMFDQWKLLVALAHMGLRFHGDADVCNRGSLGVVFDY